MTTFYVEAVSTMVLPPWVTLLWECLLRAVGTSGLDASFWFKVQEGFCTKCSDLNFIASEKMRSPLFSDCKEVAVLVATRAQNSQTSVQWRTVRHTGEFSHSTQNTPRTKVYEGIRLKNVSQFTLYKTGRLDAQTKQMGPRWKERHHKKEPLRRNRGKTPRESFNCLFQPLFLILETFPSYGKYRSHGETYKWWPVRRNTRLDIRVRKPPQVRECCQAPMCGVANVMKFLNSNFGISSLSINLESWRATYRP